jgi:hypothetical protein
MSLSEHRYALTVQWTGNLGEGTSSYRGYSRDHDLLIPGLPVLRGLLIRRSTETGSATTPNSCCWPPWPSATCSPTCTWR